MLIDLSGLWTKNTHLIKTQLIIFHIPGIQSWITMILTQLSVEIQAVDHRDLGAVGCHFGKAVMTEIDKRNKKVSLQREEKKKVNIHRETEKKIIQPWRQKKQT